MTAKPFTYTDEETGLTLEVVGTDALREGDVIRNHGCAMQLGAFKERPNDQGHPERGATRWARGYVLAQAATGAIPRGWLDTDDEGRAYWVVQGNNLATRPRYTQPETVAAALAAAIDA